MAAAGKQLLRAEIPRCCFLHEVSQWSPFKWNTDSLPARSGALSSPSSNMLSYLPPQDVCSATWAGGTLPHPPLCTPPGLCLQVTASRLPKAFLDHVTRRGHPGSLFQYSTASCITYSQLSYMSSCFCFSPTTASPKTKRDPVGAQ